MLKAKFTRGLKLHQEKVKNQGQTWVPAQGHTGTTGRETKARPGFPLRGIRERLMEGHTGTTGREAKARPGFPLRGIRERLRVRHTGTTDGEAYGND